MDQEDKAKDQLADALTKKGGGVNPRASLSADERAKLDENWKYIHEKERGMGVLLFKYLSCRAEWAAERAGGSEAPGRAGEAGEEEPEFGAWGTQEGDTHTQAREGPALLRGSEAQDSTDWDRCESSLGASDTPKTSGSKNRDGDTDRSWSD